ncbi:MAG: dUTP diphosphatase [Elusimicrobia bacterium]|nr:dUTP diphosphatase [Elusimicrobiota bacterium]
MEIKVKKIHPDAILPERAHANDAGADLFSIEEIEIAPHSSAKIKTGITIAIPENTAGFVWGKSSIESKGMKIMAGVIDEGYRGEIIVCVFNLTNEAQTLNKGKKIAQLIVKPVHYPTFREVDDELPESKRGGGGFGSTGHQSKIVR